jgi:hypothetical protein
MNRGLLLLFITTLLLCVSRESSFAQPAIRKEALGKWSYTINYQLGSQKWSSKGNMTVTKLGKTGFKITESIQSWRGKSVSTSYMYGSGLWEGTETSGRQTIAIGSGSWKSTRSTMKTTAEWQTDQGYYTSTSSLSLTDRRTMKILGTTSTGVRFSGTARKR